MPKQLTRCLQSLIVGAALISLPSLAQQATYTSVPTSGWSWSAHVDRINIDEDVAFEQGIDPEFTGIGGAAEYYTSDSPMTLSLGLTFMLYDDNEEFVQYVEDYWDDEYYSDSDATGAQVFIEYGPKYHFGPNDQAFFIVRGGVSGVFYSERSISGCSNCYSEDIDVDGGAYGVLGVGHRLGYFDLGLQFQQYFSGDLDNGLRLKLSSSF